MSPGGLKDRGVGDSQAICDGVASVLGLDSSKLVLPSSTGIIGWRLPVKSMLQALPTIVETMQSTSIYPASQGICTTDRYPKIRRYDHNNEWSIVGIAKGARMITIRLNLSILHPNCLHISF